MEQDNRPVPRMPRPGMELRARVRDIDSLSPVERWNLTMYALYANKITMLDDYGRETTYIPDPDDILMKDTP